jgi:hypothetical protein
MTSSLIEALPGPTGDPQMAPGQHTLARNSVKLPEVMFIAIATMAPGVGFLLADRRTVCWQLSPRFRGRGLVRLLLRLCCNRRIG